MVVTVSLGCYEKCLEMCLGHGEIAYNCYLMLLFSTLIRNCMKAGIWGCFSSSYVLICKNGT